MMQGGNPITLETSSSLDFAGYFLDKASCLTTMVLTCFNITSRASKKAEHPHTTSFFPEQKADSRDSRRRIRQPSHGVMTPEVHQYPDFKRIVQLFFCISIRHFWLVHCLCLQLASQRLGEIMKHFLLDSLQLKNITICPGKITLLAGEFMLTRRLTAIAFDISESWL